MKRLLTGASVFVCLMVQLDYLDEMQNVRILGEMFEAVWFSAQLPLSENYIFVIIIIKMAVQGLVWLYGFGLGRRE